MVARIYLIFNFLCIGLIGLGYLYDPNLLLGQYGLEAGSSGMDNMLRSTYGGVFIAVAFIFLVGFLNANRRSDALGIALIFFAGLAVGRLASILSVGLPPSSIMPLLYYEIVAALIASGLYFRPSQTA
ncbi:MAG: DUF4345 domain-containing protein [Pseudomonadota bacterium]